MYVSETEQHIISFNADCDLHRDYKQELTIEERMAFTKDLLWEATMKNS